MYKYMPHMGYFGLIGVVFVAGFASQNLQIARLMGAFVALSLDPLLITGGLTLGFCVKSQAKLLLAAITYGVIASIIIAQLNSSSASLLMIVLRCISVLGWAYISSAIILIRRGAEASVKY